MLRNEPQQTRASNTLSRILDAAHDVVEADGVFHITTAKVALLAGVSIGTVYRYFDDVNAIIDALAPGLEELVQDAYYEKRKEETHSDVVEHEG